MSWNQDQNGDYGGYGNYNDQHYNSGGGDQYNSYYNNYDQQQQQQPQQQQQQHYYNPHQEQSQPSYYNPNDYTQQQQQSSSSHHQPPPPQNQSSTAYNPQHHQQQQPNFGSTFAGATKLMENPMMANMAMEYGQNIMGKGQEEIKKNLDRYVSLSELKYYFAVDNSYVGKKLGILLFPFTRTEWSLRYNPDEPVQPKFDINAPDLYIPSMAYVTYVLMVGYILGLQNAFSPDSLATTASSTLVWLILEMFVIYLTLTLMNINTNLCKWDVLSFSTYKYVNMIFLLLVGLSGNVSAYYFALVYISIALGVFLVRTLKLRIEPEVHGTGGTYHSKRKLYMILLYSGLQPILIWWMTYAFIPSYVSLSSIP